MDQEKDIKAFIQSKNENEDPWDRLEVTLELLG